MAEAPGNVQSVLRSQVENTSCMHFRSCYWLFSLAKSKRTHLQRLRNSYEKEVSKVDAEIKRTSKKLEEEHERKLRELSAEREKRIDALKLKYRGRAAKGKERATKKGDLDRALVVPTVSLTGAAFFDTGALSP